MVLFNLLGYVYGRISKPAVAEHHAPTSPSMRIHHMNIGVIAWSNFEAGINVNGIILAVIDFNPPTDVVNVSTGVNVVVVALSGNVARHCERWVRGARVQSLGWRAQVPD